MLEMVNFSSIFCYVNKYMYKLFNKNNFYRFYWGFLSYFNLLIPLCLFSDGEHSCEYV